MRRVPPHGPNAERVPLRRLQHLQLALLIALGLWSIDSGIDASRGLDTLPTLTTSPASAVTFDEPALGALLADVNPNITPGESRRIAAAVIRYSAKYELDPELVTAVLLVEISARPAARSPKGAVGPMPVMPHMSLYPNASRSASTIESNIEAGCWILASNIRRLGEEEGISSYFWGSEIRGLAYLEKVQAAREEVRRHRNS